MTVLFRGRFDGLALGPVDGNDGNSGFTQPVTGRGWPLRVWGAQSSFLFLFTGTPQNLADAGNFVHNELVSMLRHDGTTGNVLHQKLLQAGTQDPYYQDTFANPTTDLYFRFWLKFSADFLSQMGANSWRYFFELSSADFSWASSVVTDPSGNPLWHVDAGGNPYDNGDVPVPADTWFMVECFAHGSSGADGRLLTRVNGQTVIDITGPNTGLPWSKVQGPHLTGGNPGVMEQWVDDIYISDELYQLPKPGLVTTRLTASGTVQARRCRLKAISYLGGAGGSIVLDDDGVTKAVFDIGSNACGDIDLEAAPILFGHSLNATLTGLTAATFITD